MVRARILLIEMPEMIFQTEFADRRKHSLGVMLTPRRKHIATALKASEGWENEITI